MKRLPKIASNVFLAGAEPAGGDSFITENDGGLAAKAGYFKVITAARLNSANAFMMGLGIVQSFYTQVREGLKIELFARGRTFSEPPPP